MSSKKQRTGAPLDIPDGLTQSQWVAMTLGKLKEETQRMQGALSMEHPLLAPLLSGLLSPSLPSVQAISSVLVTAALRGWVEGHSLISCLVTSCTSMQHSAVAVRCVGEVLGWMTLRTVEETGSYQCPYSLRTATHPFISILNSKPDCGMCLVDQTVQILTTAKPNSVRCLLELMTPFIKYLLLHPSPSPEHILTASHLHSTLLKLALTTPPHPTHSPTPSLLILRTLLHILPLTPTHNDHLIQLVSGRLLGMVRLGMQCGDRETMAALLDDCLAMCCGLSEKGLPVEPLLHCVLQLTTGENKVVMSVRHVYCIAWLMLQSLLIPTTISLTLRIASVLAESDPQPSLLLLVLPLVQLLSQPHPPGAKSHDPTPTNQNAAHSLLQTIEKHANSQWKTGEGEVNPTCPILHFSPYLLLISYSHTFTTITSSLSTTMTWLTSTTHQLHAHSSPPHPSLSILLSALSVRALHTDQQVLSPLFTAFTALAQAQPNTAPSLLPMFIYLLPLVPSPSSKLELLYTLPHLTTHPLAIGPTANTLKMLGGNPSLIAISLRLLGKLWVDHDSVYPYIHHLLTKAPPPSIPRIITRELALAKAVVIREVCYTRAEQHGEEMLSLISATISQSREVLAVAMAVEALAALCKADVADVGTVWSVVGETLWSDTRQPVVVALCSLLGLAAHVESEERRATKVFKHTALKHLWRIVFSQQPAVCSAALEALSNFKLEDFLVEHLPPEVLPSLGIAVPDPAMQESAALTETPLSGCHCVRLLPFLPQSSLPSLTHLLTALLPSELAGVPRGTVSSAMRQSQAPTPLQKAVRGVEHLLRGLCLACQEGDTVHGLVAGTSVLLHGLAPLSPPGATRERGGQAVVKEMNEYDTLLKEALSQGRVKVEAEEGEEDACGLLCALSLPNHWAVFMQRVCDSFSQAWIVRTCPLSVWEDPSAVKEKAPTATEWAKQELVKKLGDHARTDPDLAPTLMLALVGVACTSNLTHISTPTAASPPSGQWTHLTLLQQMVQGVQSILTGDPLENHPITAVLSGLSSAGLQCVAVLVSPLLVETALKHYPYLPHSLCGKLEVLAWSLWTHFNKSPVWYSAVALNQVLVMLLPRLLKVLSILNELIPFVELAGQAQSLELLSLVSSLLSSLCVAGKTSMAATVLHSTAIALSSLSPSTLCLHHAQFAAVHVANGTTLLYSTGLISDEQAMQYVSLLADLATKAPHLPAYHLSLAVALHGLLSAQHHSVLPLTDTIAVRWLQESSTTSHQAQLQPILWGLAGLIGVNPTARKLWYQDRLIPTKFLEDLFPLVKSAMEKLSTQEAPGVVATIVWLIGQVYYTLTEDLERVEQVPPNYSYLPEMYMLPTLIASLQDYSAQPVQHTCQIDCLLQVLATCDDTFPPSNLSTVVMPLASVEKFQMGCVQFLVRQCGKMKGLRLTATHVCNLLLMGRLQIGTVCTLLESLLGVLSLVMLEGYLQPLCVWALQHSTKSQEVLLSLLKGLKSVIVAAGDEKSPTTDPGLDTIHVRQAITDAWENVCADGEQCAMLCGALMREDGWVDCRIKEGFRGVQVLEEFAECLWMVNFKPDLSQASLPVLRMALNCLLHCCWVQAGREKITDLHSVLTWILHNEGQQFSVCVLRKLVPVIRCTCWQNHCKNPLVNQTELMHTILTWTMENMAEPSQMKAALLLACALASPSAPDVADSTHLEAWVASFTLPHSPPLREKLLQCLLQWMSYDKKELHNFCFTLLEYFTASPQYQKPLVWTSVAHLL